jgi:P-type Ca2+ transporter type 2B
MDSDHWEQLQAENNNFANESDRYIIERDLTFVAAFGLNDDLRDGVKDSIEKLRSAYINTRMISGDNIHTAIACAIKAGILLEGDENVPMRCMTGEEFRTAIGGVKLVRDNEGNEKHVVGDKKKFKQIAENLLVLARSTPEDKFALIVGLKDIGSQVAVTADGINDARALSNAHVGFCMGISGCEVAKDASDIIILDDNFNSVFRATQWGRNILDNIRKFIQFQLAVNAVCLIIVFLGGATLGNPPFSVIQLLWINMIMDTLAAISLATEPPHPKTMKLEKQKKTDKLILPVMWRNIIGQVGYQLLVLIVMLYSVPWWFGKGYNLVENSTITFYGTSVESLYKREHYTILFHTFVLMNLFNQINSRKLGWRDFNIFDQFFNNFLFLFVVGLEFAAQYAIVEFGGPIFRTAPLAWDQHLACFCFGLGSVFVGLGMKAIPEVHTQKFNFAFNESGQEADGSALSRISAFTSKVQKSETQRLLDSN